MTPRALIEAREQFLGMVESIRPELHRYCARLTGSVIEGEDIVQDALAKAFYALSLQPDVPPLRPWLFRIAHNQAMDRLKSERRRNTDLHEDIDVAGGGDAPDPIVVRAALTDFVSLPLVQRSALILKDVLGHSLEETAETMGTSVLAVKAALVRGRTALRTARDASEIASDRPPRTDPEERERLERYASLFNARDWDAVRALIAADCALDLVAKSQRRGKSVSGYFGNYAKEDVTLRLAVVDARPVLAVFVGQSATPAYFVTLEWQNDEVVSIRDYRYVPYITVDTSLTS